MVAAQELLAGALPPKAFRMTKEEMLHITLAFIGDVRESHLDDIKSIAAKLAADAPATQLAFSGLGCFPSWRRPNVLWIGVQEKSFEPFDQRAPMATLGRSLAEASGEFSDHKHEENVLLHVTIARVADRSQKLRNAERLADETQWKDFGETIASSVVLFESTATQKGPNQHIPLARFPLK